MCVFISRCVIYHSPCFVWFAILLLSSALEEIPKFDKLSTFFAVKVKKLKVIRKLLQSWRAKS